MVTGVCLCVCMHAFVCLCVCLALNWNGSEVTTMLTCSLEEATIFIMLVKQHLSSNGGCLVKWVIMYYVSKLVSFSMCLNWGCHIIYDLRSRKFPLFSVGAIKTGLRNLVITTCLLCPMRLSIAQYSFIHKEVISHPDVRSQSQATENRWK